MSSRVSALLPAALLLCLALWCGSFHGAASAMGAIGHQSLVLLFCLLAPVVSDPLDLGKEGRLLLLATMGLAVVSWAASPVARAGVVGLTLLPAYLLLPSAAARCWQTVDSRRLAVASMALATLITSIVALVSWQTLSLSRAALPLGHHNLLAGWLVLMLPLTFSTARYPGGLRWLGLGAGSAGLLALAATGSLLGSLAVAVQAVIASLWWKRLRPWTAATLAIVVVVSAPRWFSVARLGDPSAIARLSYLEAGWQGLVSRPTLGWGPGAVPWTIGEFMRPRLGVQPASQIVGDLHSLPIQFAYELGIVGSLLILASLFTFSLRRLRQLPEAPDPLSIRAALLSLLGGAVFALGSAPLSVPALPATAAIIAGMTMIARPTPRRNLRTLAMVTYLLLAVSVLAPLDWAHLSYDRARRGTDPARTGEDLEQARHLDPDFPLYLARSAWRSSDRHGPTADNAERALQGAQMAPGLAPLWLAAGDIGRQTGQVWTTRALRQAQALDPLSPFVAFHLATTSQNVEETLQLAQFAVSHEPRLAGARWWWDHLDLAQTVSELTGRPVPDTGKHSSSEPQVLALTLDTNPATSFSLFAFRRSPWPARLAPVVMGSGESTPSASPLPEISEGLQ